MTTDPPILRNSALATPLVVAAVALWLGWDQAVGTAVGSALVLANLWVLGTITPRVLAGLARDELTSRHEPAPPTDPLPTAFWLAALLAKFVVLIGGFLLLFQWLPAFGLMLGFAPLMLGTLGTGILLARVPVEEG